MAKKTRTTKREIWKPIAGYETLYEVSSLGRVRSFHYWATGKILAFLPGKDDYRVVCLQQNGVPQRYLVSRLVCMAFYGPPPTPDHEAAHWDGDHHNNVVSNLRWATKIENEADKDRHGRRPVGSQHCHAKFTEAQIRKIRTLHGRISNIDLGLRFGVNNATISRIQRRQTWKHMD